jgi:Zn-dependent M16 (insulinase) family peptidase
MSPITNTSNMTSTMSSTNKGKSNKFILQSTHNVPFAPTPVTISTYKHTHSDFRIIFVPLTGPLCSTTILIPTQSTDDSGKPHTLEHLIFCGSKTYPHRGFLDNLATRCLSTGSNAYTAEDHTAYTLTNAGSEGLMRILPVFVDHVLNPTLTDEQFVTGNWTDYGSLQCHAHTETFPFIV